MIADQVDGESGEWMMLRREHVTASSFGDIAKRRNQHPSHLWLLGFCM